LKYDFYFLKLRETEDLFDILEESGIEARFVGGCVRDSVLGLKADDLDLAVDCDILSLKGGLEKNGIKCVATGLKYGSITVLLGGRRFEITSLRTDAECFGRSCDIKRISSFEDDARRRDFTMNALYVSRSGRLFDYFCGVLDLEKRCVKFIGDPRSRIREDYLRIFRYYRFCSKFGDLRNEYKDIISSESQNVRLLSIERIQKELFCILRSNHYIEIINFMNKTGVFSEIFKSVNTERLCRISGIVNREPSLELKLYTLFEFEDLMHVLRLTRSQRAIMKNYRNFKDEDLLYCLYKMGRAFAEDVALIKSIDPLKVRFPLDIPKFPVSFRDLQGRPEDISSKLKGCEKWWASSGFIKDKEECLSYIETL
jgi:poly(A) polymerase